MQIGTKVRFKTPLPSDATEQEIAQAQHAAAQGYNLEVVDNANAGEVGLDFYQPTQQGTRPESGTWFGIREAVLEEVPTEE